MTEVRFNLQEHLQDMEDRLTDRITAVHSDVRLQNGRIRKLESAVERIDRRHSLENKTLGSGITAALGFVAYKLFGFNPF